MEERTVASDALLNERSSNEREGDDLGASEARSPATLADLDLMGAPRSQGPHDRRGRHLGRYLVLGVLGRGGMGVVVEAHDEVLDRSVALKLLNASAVRRGQLRLLREAQALARLSHPNVVQVYDVGDLDGQTFIAMELVRGRTLREWGREEPRPWRTAVPVYLQAARGLAAAHDKGLVHRDFKPENCIIDDEGRVRVLDFGLAREIAPSSPTPHPDVDEPRETEAAETEEERPSGHVLADKLTRPGVLMGTLGYMAFEQLQGRPADAYSDQFAFCASLYEALYGVAPYPGGSPSSLFAAMYSDRRKPPPPGIVVPRRLSRALWQGLSRERTKRWPSMHALIAELEALSRVGRSRALVGVLGVGIAAAAGFAFVRDAPDPCPEVATALAGTWDADARARVEQAFATHGPDDPSLLPRLVNRLDGYANGWATMTRESCQATFVVRRQSEAQLEQRTRCLERRRNRLVATIDALADAADGDELTRAVVLPFRLPPLEPCDESAQAELAATPVAVSSDERHAEVRRQIDEASTLRDAGQLPEATALAEAALVEARKLDDLHLLAETLECLGHTQSESGSLEASRVTLEEAIVVGNEAGDDATVARAWIWLQFVLMTRGDLDEADHSTLAVRAAVVRSNDDVLRAWLLNNLGILAAEQGALALARERFEAALAIKQDTLGADHVDVGIAWLNLGGMLIDAGDYRGAMEALEQARAIFEATVGSFHFLTTYALANQCPTLHGLGHVSRAIETCGQAIAQLETSHGDPRWERRTRFTMGESLWLAGREAEALAMARRAASMLENEDPTMTAAIQRWIEQHPQSTETSP
jgi:serine/threonine protein kinase/tetratricopeptide (TPR) repeat protein